MRGSRGLQRGLIDARFEVGAAAGFAGRELNVRSSLLGHGRAAVRRKNLGLENIEAVRSGRRGSYFVGASIRRRETQQIGDRGCTLTCDGIAGGREFLQQNAFFPILAARAKKIGNGGAVLLHIRDVALNPVRAEIGAGYNLFEIEDHAQIADRAGGGHGLRPPLLGFDGAILAAGHELERAGEEILARGQNQKFAVGRERHFPLGFGIAPNVERETGGAARLEFCARLPESGLRRASRRQLSDVKKLQLTDVVECDGALRTGYLRQKIHVRWKAGRGGELLAGALQPQEKAGTGIDFVILALHPACFLRRRIPIAEQRGKIFRLQIEQRARGNVAGKRGHFGSERLECGPIRADGGDSREQENGGTFHDYCPPVAFATAGVAARATRRGRTIRSCSSSWWRIGWRAKFSRSRRSTLLTSASLPVISLRCAAAFSSFCANCR